ncbi:DUF4926 domain-containing protein [Pedobacter cryoconitis]|uniref:DUF4926 domain-containing protein n=1 Tax=Pedobacter cryoconitis TaxID=188932 RepID=UPI00161CCC36|nr:DUF4926 domain-containing protein [Pedobacter cryoconitis]MBB5646539.1 hypothetical protein [Pedobacter cryoconitis]
MIEIYDVIRSLVDLNDKVPAGSKGTVLIIYPNFPPDYEIEFVNDSFETLDVLTVKSSNIVKV